MTFFTVEERARVQDRAIELVSSDERVVAGAVVGSLAYDAGDRWSDLDLTFAVADGVPLDDVLRDWTRRFEDEFDAVHLFDLPSGRTIYRVFLLPDLLQLDLSFTPASAFGAGGPRFRLLFGETVERPFASPRPAEELLGYAVLAARHSRVCVERGRYWDAEYWVSNLRDYALTLACRRRGLPASYARGFDDLPADVRDRFTGALVRSLERGELLRAHRVAVAGLLHETDEAPELAAKVAPQLRVLAAE